jgi:valyl-tRNA synthetase
VEARLEEVIGVTRALRALRAEASVPPIQKLPKAVISKDFGELNEVIRTQAWLETLEISDQFDETSVTASHGGVQMWLPTAGLVDPMEEQKKLAAQLEKVEAEIAKSAGKLANDSFVERAKPEVVQKERQTLADWEEEKNRLLARLQAIAG